MQLMRLMLLNRVPPREQGFELNINTSKYLLNTTRQAQVLSPVCITAEPFEDSQQPYVVGAFISSLLHLRKLKKGG